MKSASTAADRTFWDADQEAADHGVDAGRKRKQRELGANYNNSARLSRGRRGGVKEMRRDSARERGETEWTDGQTSAGRRGKGEERDKEAGV